MSRRRSGTPALRGLVITLLIAAVVVGALNFEKLPLIRNHNTLSIEFAEAGGLKVGDEVRVSGAKVGKVDEIRLVRDRVVVEVALSEGAPALGEKTSAAIVTTTLLGRAAVALEPAGGGELSAGDTIPVARTASPYSLTSALNDLVDETTEIDKKGLTAAIDELSSTFADTPEDVAPALDGITALADVVSSNDGALRQLLARAGRVTEVLASRDEEFTSLLTAGDSLLRELNARQDVVVQLLASTRDLAGQLQALVSENRRVIGPALDELNGVVRLLNDNKRNLQESITGLSHYAMAFGEAISSGPFFDAYIQNLTSPATLAPIISGVLPQ